MTKKPAWSILRYCALLVIGNAMFALGFNLFLVPNSLNVGGLSGIAMILQRVLGKGGIGLYTAVMNVPLFVIGYRRLGRGFFFGSLLGMACNSLLIDLLAGLPAPQVETMLGVIFGGVLTGAGLGLVFLPGATTGGTDILARLLKRHFRESEDGLCDARDRHVRSDSDRSCVPRYLQNALQRDHAFHLLARVWTRCSMVSTIRAWHSLFRTGTRTCTARSTSSWTAA